MCVKLACDDLQFVVQALGSYSKCRWAVTVIVALLVIVFPREGEVADLSSSWPVQLESRLHW